MCDRFFYLDFMNLNPRPQIQKPEQMHIVVIKFDISCALVKIQILL